MISVTTNEAQNRLSELLTMVESGRDEVTICRNGKPVARLVPATEKFDRLKPTPSLGPVIFHESPTAPLDQDSWPTTNFDPKRRKQAIRQARAFRQSLARKGAAITAGEISAAITENRK